MIEKTILDYLASLLPEPVYMEVPERPPDNFVVLELTGSGRQNRLDSAMLAVQSYGGSLYDAAELNCRVKDLMDKASDSVTEIASISLNTDYNFTDTATKRYRYQAVFDIMYYN